MRIRMIMIGAALAAAAGAVAQDPPPTPPAEPTVINADEPRLVFEREVFEYPGRSRRDPFQPLTGRNSGPLFSDLRLQLILYSPDPSQSQVGLSDLSGNRYRVRRGESVGNATVIDIAPTRVIFSIDDFGLRRQEILTLKATPRQGGGQ